MRSLRRRSLLLAAPLVLLLVPALLLVAQRPSAAGSTALTIFTNSVSVSHGSGDFTAATDGATLAAGDRVRTDDTGHALITFFDGSTLEVEPSSVVQIDTTVTNANGSITIELTQTLGRTWTSVQKLTRTDSKFEIKTPAATAVVRGTAFLTEVLPSGETRLHTTEGTVAVSAQGTTVLVSAGQATTVQRDQAPAAPSAAPRPTNTVQFGMHSPAHLVVVDPLGRACGVTTPGAKVVREIPGCDVTVGEPELIDVPNVTSGRYRAVITSIDPGGAFTLTARGSDPSGDAAFDQSLAGTGEPGMVFGSSLDVQVGADGRLSTSGLSALGLISGATPSPSPTASPSPSPSPAPTTTPAPTSSIVPNLPLPTLPVATATPTPTPEPTQSASPSPSASPSQSASPSPSPSASPSPSPSASPSPTTVTPAPSPATPAPTTTPVPGCSPSNGVPGKCG